MTARTLDIVACLQVGPFSEDDLWFKGPNLSWVLLSERIRELVATGLLAAVDEHRFQATARAEMALAPLLTDPACPEEVLLCFAQSEREHWKVGVALHPACPPEIRRELLETPRVALECLRRRVADADVLNQVRHLHEGSIEVEVELARQPALPAETAARMVEAHSGHPRSLLLEALARNPVLSVVPRVRDLLFRSVSSNVIRALLEAGRPEPFAHLIERYHRRDEAEALGFLRTHGVPPGAALPPRLLEALLASDDPEARVVAVRAIAEGAAHAALAKH